MSLDDRICIAGAGPAGLAAAFYLRERGYRNVEVFEASGRVGGKVCSYRHNDHVYDVGAIVLAPGYNNVLRLAERHGVDFVEGPRHEYLNPTTGERTNMHPSLRELASPAMFLALMRFIGVLYRRRALAGAGFPGLNSDGLLTADQYFEKEKMAQLLRYFAPCIIGCGYGYSHDVAAAYHLKMNYLGIPESLEAAARWVRMKRQQPVNGVSTKYATWSSIPGGFQRLFDTMAGQLDVHLRAPLTHIDRHKGKVAITAGNNSYVFDKIILTMDPHRIADLFGADEREHEVMSRAHFVSYHSVLCEVDRAQPHLATFFTNHMTAASRGHTIAYVQPGGPENMVMAYAFGGDGVTHEKMEKNIADDLALDGVHLQRVVQHNDWKYFPHVGPGVMPGFIADLESLQGVDNTYYSGEVFGFSTVENVCEYSRALVERFFA